MTAIERIIEFGLTTNFEDIPANVIQSGKHAILDTLGSMYAGAKAEGVASLVDLTREWGGAPQSRLVCGGRRLPAPLAALVNGVAARGWDLDDVHEQFHCHVNASIVPAALAIADHQGGVSGRDFLAAVLVGSEFVCRLAACPKLSFSTTGMSLSYQCTFLGAALTSARLLGLDHDEARHAIGIAYARLAGNQQGYVDGAMTVRLMQGVAAEGGVVAALMASRGLTGASDSLEGRFGYFSAFQRGDYDAEPLTQDLGHHWECKNISLKPLYPCCKYTHGPIDATIESLGQDQYDMEGHREARSHSLQSRGL